MSAGSNCVLHESKGTSQYSPREKAESVNNIDRIADELADEAGRRAGSVGLSAEKFLEAALEIVDREDQHQIQQRNINQEMRSMLLNIAREAQP